MTTPLSLTTNRAGIKRGWGDRVKVSVAAAF